MALPPLLKELWQELQRATLYNPLLLSFLLLSSFLLLLKLIRGRKLNLPPSPRKLPLIGNLHQLGTLPHRSLRALSNKYGPLMLLHLGQSPTLVVSSTEMAKEMMKIHGIVFSNRPKTTAANIFFYGCIDVGFAPYGEYWRQVRKVSVLELLSMRRVLSFQYVREEEVSALINKLGRASLNGDSVNLSGMLLATSSNILSRCVLGRKAAEEYGKSKLGELARRVIVQFTAFCFGDLFPPLGWLDHVTSLISRLKETSRELGTLFDQVIEEHMVSDNDQSDKKDFIDVLLQLQKDGLLDMEFTQENLKAILLDMTVGGTDTTATTTEWTMAELVKNPSMMKKAQEEIRRVVGKKSKIDLNDINQMDYLKCIIKESLRLHPPTALSVPRESSESVKFEGYDIPPKVFVNAWAIQRDPKLWDRAEEFLPERFQNNPIDFKGHDFQFIVFGGGRRGCPGMSFAVATVEYVIANLLYWFDWKLPGDAAGESLDMSEGYGLTVCKKIPLCLVPLLYSA